MTPFNKNPWGDQQDSFENMTQKVTKPVVKAVSDAVKAVATDVKQQMTGDYPTSPENTLEGSGQGQGVQQKSVQEEARKKQQLILQTRQNLSKINEDIKRIREGKKKKEQEKTKTEEKKKEDKKVDEKKKNEPFWKKMLKGKSGSKEGNVRASG